MPLMCSVSTIVLAASNQSAIKESKSYTSEKREQELERLISSSSSSSSQGGAMADVVASSIVRFVSDKLGTQVMNELGLLKGVDEELEKLKSTLSTIQDVLEDAEAQQVKGKALLNWLKKLKDVAFDIDDVLDEAAVEALKHSRNGKIHKLSLVPKSLRFRHKIAHKMKEIRKRLDEISEEKSKFHLSTLGNITGTIKDSEVDSRIRETGSFVNESEICGRIQDKEQIINFLMDESVENNLRAMPIVGLGGLGKTTLAQLVYNDQQVCQHFDQRIWVYVFQKFDTKSIIRSIIESVTNTKYALPDSMDQLQRKLVEQIAGKKFLLVLDDIWNEDYESWDGLRSLLNKGGRRSKVIATTRSTRVADIMGTEKPHLPTVLSEDDCWSLFERRALGGFAGSANYYQTLVSIGKEIVKKCGGLPLAAKALGDMMWFKREVSQWLDVRDNEIWRLFADDELILPALMLSYNHLPSRLKQCFAYCSIFPKGSKIQVKSLAQMWVAEGFVRPSDHGSTDMEYVGFQYVEQLLSRSLLENGGTNRVVFVRMHDVVHDLATFVAGDECLIMDGNGNISGGSRYTSLMSDKIESFDALAVNHLHKLRSFYFIRTLRIICSTNEDGYQKFVGKIFSHMKLLRVLHLRGLPMNVLPAAVNNLIHLRQINLSSTDLETLHENIGLLYNLQSLNLRGCMHLKTLPASIGNLVNLATLNLSGCSILHSLPDTIGRMTNLKTLDISYASNLETLPESIGDLVNLFTLNLSRCHKLHSLPHTMGRMMNLKTLDISYASSLETLPESLSSLSNLQRLDLGYCWTLHELPKNIQRMRSLAHLRIDGCDGLTSMPVGMGQLCQLRELAIYVLGDGESNGSSLAELGSMKNLEGELGIRNLENARTVEEAREANLREKQGLHTLRLDYWGLISYMHPITFEFSDADKEKIEALMDKVIALSMDANRARLSEDVLESLQPPQNLKSLSIAGYVGRVMPGWITDSSVPNLEILQLKAFVRCEKLPASLEKFYCLKELTLCAFPNIKCLPQLGQLPCLESLELAMLPAVKCLGSELYGTGDGAFPALKVLIISYMLNLEEWRSSGTDGERFLPRLRQLNLLDCPKLAALPSTFPSVKELTMNADDEMLLSSLEHGAFPNLQKWVVKGCKRDENQLFMRLKSIESARKSRDSSFMAHFY